MLAACACLEVSAVYRSCLCCCPHDYVLGSGFCAGWVVPFTFLRVFKFRLVAPFTGFLVDLRWSCTCVSLLKSQKCFLIYV